MDKIYCSNCKKIIVEDAKSFSKENKEKYVQCPYCSKIMFNFYYDNDEEDWDFLE